MLIISNYAKYSSHFIKNNRSLFLNFTQSLFYFLRTEVILKRMKKFHRLYLLELISHEKTN